MLNVYSIVILILPMLHNEIKKEANICFTLKYKSELLR